MKANLKLILALIVAAACIWWSASRILSKRSESQNKARYLAVLARLNQAVREGLRDYYHTNGRYPDKLSDLALPLPKGAKPEMLDSFRYVSHGAFCVLTCGTHWADEPEQMHKEHATEGKVVFVEEYVDQQMQTRIEYPDGLQYQDTRVEKQYRDGRLLSTTEYRNGQKISQEAHDSP